MPNTTLQHQDQGWVLILIHSTGDNSGMAKAASITYSGMSANSHVEGRGFTLSELKLAGIQKKEAKTIGIAVDTRRRSKSEEGQQLNVNRLKEYKTRLVVFPKKAGKPKSGDATGDDLTAHITRDALPLPTAYESEAPRKIADDEKEFSAFRTLRNARADARNAGKRAARAAVKAAAEEAKK